MQKVANAVQKLKNSPQTTQKSAPEPAGTTDSAGKETVCPASDPGKTVGDDKIVAGGCLTGTQVAELYLRLRALYFAVEAKLYAGQDKREAREMLELCVLAQEQLRKRYGERYPGAFLRARGGNASVRRCAGDLARFCLTLPQQSQAEVRFLLLTALTVGYSA